MRAARAVCCSILLLPSLCSGGDPSWDATLEVDLSKPAASVLAPGQLFGSFFEDFLHAGDGGAYAEKLGDRAFAQSLGAKGGWRADSGSATIDDSRPLNTAVPRALWLRGDAAASNGGPLSNGIAARAGERLRLSAFVSTRGAGGHPATLTASLVDDGKELGEATLLHNGTVYANWTRVTVTLTASAGCDACRLQLRASSAGARVGAAVVSLFPEETFLNRANGLRTDVAGWLNESRPPFLRAPGGCYVEGKDIANGWYWKRTLGPIEERSGHMNDVWGYWSDDGLGMAEVLQMADDVGARPLLVVNAGCSTAARHGGHCLEGDAVAPFVQDALDAVEYATGATTTEWGAKRAAAGREAPYVLQALGIGNENCQSGNGYAANYLTIAMAVRAKYPNLPLVLGCETRNELHDVLKAEPAISDFCDMYDIHQRHDPTSLLQHVHTFDDYPRSGEPKLFVSEYSSPRKLFPNSTTLGAAVAEAAYMAGMEANGDVVQIASYGDLMARPDDDHGSAGVSTISISAAASFGSPSWAVQKLFFDAQPAARVPAVLTAAGRNCTAWLSGGSCTGDPHPSTMLVASVSTSTAGAVQAKLVNYGPQSVQLSAAGLGGATAGTVTYLAGGEKDVNSFADPRRVAAKRKAVSIDGGAAQLNLPPWSATVLAVDGGLGRL